jgi:hypothetical protein
MPDKSIIRSHKEHSPANLARLQEARFLETGLCSLIFLLACAQGYSFGSGDLALYLPFVMHLHDQAMFGGDLLMQSLGSYAAPLWQCAAWLLKFTSAESLFLVLFLVQTAVILAGARFFYRQLFGNNGGWALFLLMLVIERSSGAMNTYGLNPFGYFQPGGLAFGVVLFMYGVLDKGQWKTAGLLAGTMFLYHPFTALWACLLYFLRAVTGTGERVSIWKKSAGAVILAAGASPYIFSFLHASLAHSPLTFDTGLWIELARMRLNHAFFISRWVPDRFLHFFLILAGIVLFRRHRAFRRTLPFVFATLMVLFTLAVAEIASSRFLLQLNLARCSYLLFVLFFAFLAWRVAESSRHNTPIQNSLWMLLSFLLMIYPFLERNHGPVACSLVAAALAVFGATLIKARIPCAAAVCAGLVVVSAASGERMYERYKTAGVLFNLPAAGPWHDVQLWVRDHVPKNQCLMTPSYIEGFRSYSLHPIYGDFKDGGSHLFCSSTIFEWWKRMQALGITPGMKNSDFPRAYHEHAVMAAQTSGIRYVVFDKQYAVCGGKTLYQNDRFGVFVSSDSVRLILRQ